MTQAKHQSRHADPDPLQAPLAAHKAGRRDEAERGYRALLADQPGHVGAQQYLGVLLAERGALAEAQDWLASAAELAPANAEVLANLAAVRRSAGEAARAREAADRALARQPDLGVALYNRALAALSQDDAVTAAADLDRLLAARPDDPGLLYQRGRAALMQSDSATAAQVLARAHRLAPQARAIALNLARARTDLDDPQAALEALAAVPENAREHAEWYHQRGRALFALDDADNAAAALRRATQLAPGDARHLNELAGCLAKLERPAESERTYREALASLPSDGSRTDWRALILRNLADACHRQGHPANAREACEAAYALEPLRLTLHSNLLLWRQYDPAETPESLYRATLDWAERFARPIEATATRPAPAPAAKTPLTVGVLANKLRRHPQLWLYLAAFENLDPAVLRLAVYHGGERSDAFTERLKARAALWHEVGEWDDAAIAEQMRRDGVDILLSKAGHAEGRLLVAAHQPAPVQVQWGGFGTTGMASMDWFLADWVECPPGSEAQFRERLYRLPDDYVVYTPPDDAPAVGPLPARERGAITFGCLNTPSKLNRETAALWRQVLDAVPGSRLLVRTTHADFQADRPQLRTDLASWGLPNARIDLIGNRPHRELLAVYNQIDIALDPWPYSGGLTTIEALWMGVPVVTLPGRGFVSRHAATHLTAAGLGDWVAGDAAGYVDQAARWARAPEALAELRAGLRERVRASPLCDGPRFARNLTAALRDMHARAAEGS